MLSKGIIYFLSNPGWPAHIFSAKEAVTAIMPMPLRDDKGTKILCHFTSTVTSLPSSHRSDEIILLDIRHSTTVLRHEISRFFSDFTC